MTKIVNSRRRGFGHFIHALLLVASLALGGCLAVHAENVAPASSASSSAAESMMLDRLYFGRDIPGGGQVSEAQWAAFLADIVTPRFPQGLTVWRTDGQWRGADGAIVHEPGFVLELLHPAGAAPDRAVAEIIADYRQRFHQESVLRVRSRVDAQF